jgi:phosphotransferase system IIB component
MRDQEQLQQQEISGDKLKNAMGVFQMLGQIGQSDRQALDSPQMQAFVKRYVGGSGVPLPTNAQGGIDVNAFLTPLSSLTANGPDFERFNTYDPGSPQRAQILANYGGEDSAKAALLGAPRVPTAAERDANLSKYAYYMSLIGSGYDPRSLIPQINAAATASGQPQVALNDKGQVVPVGGTVGLGQTTKTAAQNTSAYASADLHNAQTNLTELKTKYFPRMTEAQIGKLLSSTNLSDTEAKAIPQRLAIGWQNANTAANRANYEATRLQMSIRDFQQLGDHSPQAIAAYSGLVTSHQNQVKLDQSALNQVRTQMSNILRNSLGTDPDANSASAKLLKTYQDEQHQISTRLGAETQALDKLQAGRAAFTQRVQTNILHSQGAPSNVRAQKPATAPYGPVAHDPKTGKEYNWDAKRGAYVDASGAPYQP